MADIDDLKAAFGQHMVALNQRDLEAFATLYHDHVVVFTDNAPFAVEGKAGFQQGVQTAWDNCGSSPSPLLIRNFSSWATRGLLGDTMQRR